MPAVDLAQLRETFAACWGYHPLVALEQALLAGRPPDHLDGEESLLLGEIQDRRHEWWRAARSFAQAVERSPDKLLAAYHLVTTAADSGDEPMALAALLQHLAPALDQLDERCLRGTLRVANSLGQHDLAWQAFELSQSRFPGSVDPAVERRLLAAQANQPRLDLALVSLGENCLPWQLPNRWGLRRDPASEGAHGPMDLGQTSTERAADIVAGGFAGLIDATLLNVDVPGDDGTPLPLNWGVAYSYNHEQGPHWIANDFTALRQRYTQRIAALQALCAGRRPVFLHYSEYPGDLQRLVDAVAGFMRDRDYRLLIVDVRDDRALPEETPQMRCLQLALPRPDYVWYRPDDVDSAEGVAWEGRLQEFVLRAGLAD